MKIKINGEIFKVGKDTTIGKIISQIGLRPETVIPIRGEEILNLNETINEGDEIILKKVIAGG